jgi:hypothetical protein
MMGKRNYSRVLSREAEVGEQRSLKEMNEDLIVEIMELLLDFTDEGTYCPGWRKPFVSMKTCRRCHAIQEVNKKRPDLVKRALEGVK